MGVPVVTSDLPGMRVAVNLTRMGETVPPRNSKRIAEAVVKVIKNKKRYSNSREEAKRIFSFDKTVDSYEKIFRETYGVKVELESTFL
jgi:glycosyltransferase involved in cell wall biosynthesis